MKKIIRREKIKKLSGKMRNIEKPQKKRSKIHK